MQNLLNALGKDIKPAGQDRWLCKCPVHNDKDFAMYVNLKSDNSISAHCLACGANGLQLYRALNLDLSELFGDRDNRDNYVPHRVKEEYEKDKWFIAIYNSTLKKGMKVSLNERKRYKLAVARRAGIEKKYEGLI